MAWRVARQPFAEDSLHARRAAERMDVRIISVTQVKRGRQQGYSPVSWARMRPWNSPP